MDVAQTMQTHIKSHPHSSINILAIPFGAPSRSLLRLGVATRHGHGQRSARALTSRVAMALPVVHFVTGNHNKLLEVRAHTGDVVPSGRARQTSDGRPAALVQVQAIFEAHGDLPFKLTSTKVDLPELQVCYNWMIYWPIKMLPGS